MFTDSRESPSDKPTGVVNPRFSRRSLRWLAAVAVILVMLVAIITLHLGTQISPSAQRTLYDEVAAVVSAEREYAVVHNGEYTSGMTNLATANPELAYLVEANSPVVQYSVDEGAHGYFIELADQSTGGAASFSVLMSDNDTAVLSCTGPGPLCSGGGFKLPRRDFALNAESQRVLYQQMVELLVAEHRYQAQNNGSYGDLLDLAAYDTKLAFTIAPNNPVYQFNTDSSNHGYYGELSNENTGGSASFTALIPNQGAPVLTCVGAAPLCSHGIFKLPSGTIRLGAALTGK